MLNKIVLTTSPYFRPIVVRKVWLILSRCIRNTFGDLYIGLIISSIFPISPISSNLYNRRFQHIESQAFRKFTKQVCKYFPLHKAFLIKLKSVNIWSVVLQFFLKPAWEGESMSLLSISFSMRLQISELNSFPNELNRVFLDNLKGPFQNHFCVLNE